MRRLPLTSHGMWTACICRPVNTAQCRPITAIIAQCVPSSIQGPGPFLSNCCRVYVRASVRITYILSMCPTSIFSAAAATTTSASVHQPSTRLDWMATRRLAGVTFGARSNKVPASSSSKWQLLHRTRQMLHSQTPLPALQHNTS